MAAKSNRPILKSKWLWLCAIILVAGGLRSAHAWSQDHFILINQTQSLPNWVFIVDKGMAPRRGDMVAFMPGPNPYYPDNLPFVKIVRGIGGDEESIDGAEVVVNGERLGAIKSLTGANPKVTAIDPGTIPDGQYFVWSPSPDSFDSRYKEIGYVEEVRIIGRARPLL